jgi:polyribonucleotide nucleotidyltransferase
MIEKWDSEKIRLDGRRSNEIREIKLMKDYLPNVHGSSIFSRGGTEVLSVSTLGKLSEKLSSDSLLSKHHKTFIHHYNFPQFAVNEVTSYRGISRREVGHGELVEKAFSFIVPKTEKFPHTIRVVSEVLSSDGSSSQASICSTSLSLMSSGVPLERHVAGISIGLFRGEIYTDINGIEDKLGEMDFKIAGTDRGICSVQLDVKNRGISLETFRNSIEKAKESRLEIIGIMNREIPYHRKKLAPEVTKCFSFKIEKALIGLVVGPKGRNINRIMEDNDSFIEIQNDGNVLIYNKNQEKLDKTYQDIRRIIRENS